MPKCLICGTETEFLFSTRDYARPDDLAERRLNWCAKCEFGRLEGEFTPSEVSNFYPADYYTHNISDARSRKLAFSERLRVHLAWRFDNGYHFSLDELPGHGGVTVCDVGCGNGNYLRLFKSNGYHVVGVEPDPMARSKAADVGEILNGTAEDLPSDLFDREFDVVLMSHVLEHCIDPLRAISNAKKLLSEGGTLVVEVPNNSALGFLMFRAAWPWSDIPRHLNFFTENSLQALFHQEGLMVSNIRYCGYTRQFDPTWVLQQQNIWKQIGSGRAPNFDRAAWALLLRSAMSQSKNKYDSIRMHAHHALGSSLKRTI